MLSLLLFMFFAVVFIVVAVTAVVCVCPVHLSFIRYYISSSGHLKRPPGDL